MGRGTSATLDPDHLRVFRRGGGRTDIPLAAVREARAGDGLLVEIVLTDGVTHQLQGRNPTATAAFVTALNDALPEEREPAGSTLVTTGAAGPDGATDRARLKLLAWLVGVPLAYVAYVVGVGVTLGSDYALGLTLTGIPLLLGLVTLAITVFKTVVRVRLARRGITVRAARSYDALGRPVARYDFTATDGVAYGYRSNRNASHVDVVYDPRSPQDNVGAGSFVLVVLRYTVTYAFALALLALGAFMTWDVFT